MLKNYIIIFWKVLQRHPFFTFVSLFGISITLMVLIVLSAVFDSTFGGYGPEKENNRLLYVFGGTFSLQGEKNHWTMRGSSSPYFYDQTVRKLKLPEMVSVLSLPQTVICYNEDRKIEAMRKYTDGNFWKVFDFEFLDGSPYGESEVERSDRVAVIDQKTSLDYFGTEHSVGQTIQVEGKVYRVCGVVEETSISRTFPFGNIFVPWTTSGQDLKAKVCHGTYLAVIKARSPGDRQAIQAEYQGLVGRFPFPDPYQFNTITSYADTYLEIFTRNLLDQAGENSRIGLFIVLITILVLLFMSFPAMNLVNINITRILERASEIGIRRSYGASIRTLLGQFLFENILITLIGGTIGFCLALLAVHLINRSAIFPYYILEVNVMVVLYALALSILFGVLSGIIPAYRMARMNIVNALKS